MIRKLIFALLLPALAQAEEFKFNENISCKDFSIIFASDKVSAAQKEALFSSVKGKAISWIGEVVEVQKDIFGSYQILLKCNPDSFVSDVAVYLKEDIGILDIMPKKRYLVKGVLTSWGNFIPHVVKQATIEPFSQQQKKSKSK